MNRITATIFGLLLFIGGTGEVQAASKCFERAEMLDRLAKKFSEAPIAVGISSKGLLVEVLSDKDGETWSIILTNPKGRSCLVVWGDGWRNLERISTDPEA